jgi:hypothetical protein
MGEGLERLLKVISRSGNFWSFSSSSSASEEGDEDENEEKDEKPRSRKLLSADALKAK